MQAQPPSGQVFNRPNGRPRNYPGSRPPRDNSVARGDGAPEAPRTDYKDRFINRLALMRDEAQRCSPWQKFIIVSPNRVPLELDVGELEELTSSYIAVLEAQRTVASRRRDGSRANPRFNRLPASTFQQDGNPPTDLTAEDIDNDS